MAERVTMPKIPLSRADDLHGLEHMDDADLVLFMAGNQFMVMDELLEKFRSLHPHIKRVFFETLPPGLELRQILAGGALFGDKMLTGRPDIYTSVSGESMLRLKERSLAEKYFVYLHNRLVLMVPEGNPKGIKTIQDLARDDIKVSQPGEMEDITQYITEMYEKAGGDALTLRIMEEKRAEGTTILTLVHHRETPLRLKIGTADVGPVWATEVVNAHSGGAAVESVEVGSEFDQHDKVNYFIAGLREAPNPRNAALFLEFIKSKASQEIYRSYGFLPHFA